MTESSPSVQTCRLSVVRDVQRSVASRSRHNSYRYTVPVHTNPQSHQTLTISTIHHYLSHICKLVGSSHVIWSPAQRRQPRIFRFAATQLKNIHVTIFPGRNFTCLFSPSTELHRVPVPNFHNSPRSPEAHATCYHRQRLRIFSLPCY